MIFYEFINLCLSKFGCRKAFGVPGSLVMPIWQNVRNLDVVLCSHEGEASYVATGYAKSAGELVTVITTGGPGVTNSVGGIAAANKDSVPLLYISGRPPVRTDGLGLRQETSGIDRTFRSDKFTESLTKRSVEITQIESAAEVFFECCKIAVSGRQGSVHVSIAEDIQSMELLSYPAVEDRRISPPHIPEMPKLSHPLIIMGWGCWQAGCAEQVYHLAEKIHAPILVTSKAYCCIQANHPYYLGKLGYGYHQNIESFLLQYAPQQVLVFGSSMGRKDISDSCRKILEQADCWLYSNDFEGLNFRFPKGKKILIQNIKKC